MHVDRFVHAARAERAERLRNQSHCSTLCEEASSLAYPMCCITYWHFRDAGRLVTHEEAREKRW